MRAALLVAFLLAGALAFVAGPGSLLFLPADTAVTALADSAVAGSQIGLSRLGWVSPDMVELFSALAALLAPGVVCTLAMSAACASFGVRVAAAAVAVAAALASFTVTSFGSAGTTLALAAALAFLLLAGSYVTSLPLAALSGVVGGRLALAATSGELDSVRHAAAEMGRHLGGNGLVVPFAVLVALLPLATVFGRTTRS